MISSESLRKWKDLCLVLKKFYKEVAWWASLWRTFHKWGTTTKKSLSLVTSHLTSLKFPIICFQYVNGFVDQNQHFYLGPETSWEWLHEKDCKNRRQEPHIYLGWTRSLHSRTSCWIHFSQGWFSRNLDIRKELWEPWWTSPAFYFYSGQPHANVMATSKTWVQ